MMISCGDELFRGLVQASALPPPEPNKADNGQWCDHQVNDTGVQTLCGLVTKLLGCFGTDGTLCTYIVRCCEDKNHAEYNQVPFHGV